MFPKAENIKFQSTHVLNKNKNNIK